MNTEKRYLKRPFMGLVATLAAFALILQFYLIVKNVSQSPLSLPVRIINYFSFFTILGNMLVACSMAVPLLAPRSKLGLYFLRPKTIAAVTLYIAFVGIGYNALLRHAWNPQGFQRLADELLHLVVPILYIIYWLAFAPAEKMPVKAVFPWMVFPCLYLAYSFIRGAVTGIYPYYFIDAGKLGYPQVLMTSGVLALVFFLLSFIIVAVEKHRSTHGQPMG